MCWISCALLCRLILNQAGNRHEQALKCKCLCRMPIQPSRYKHLAPTPCKEAIEKWPERYTWPSDEELSQLAHEDFVKITFLDKVDWVRLPAQALLPPRTELFIMHGSVPLRPCQGCMLNGCVQSGMPVGRFFAQLLPCLNCAWLHCTAGEAVCLSGQKQTSGRAYARRQSPVALASLAFHL